MVDGEIWRIAGQQGLLVPAADAAHWAAAGRTKEALAASVQAARQAQAMFAWRRRARTSNARSGCGTRCPTRPSSPARPRRAVRLAGQTGAAPRAAEAGWRST
jgi:hypothetical protein